MPRRKKCLDCGGRNKPRDLCKGCGAILCEDCHNKDLYPPIHRKRWCMNDTCTICPKLQESESVCYECVRKGAL